MSLSIDPRDARDARAAREIAPGMLAVISERGPVDHLEALHELKVSGRCKRGVTFAAAHDACQRLAAEGKVVSVPPWKWRAACD